MCRVYPIASKSGGAPPHSKTQAKLLRPEWRPRFGVRQCSAAVERTSLNIYALRRWDISQGKNAELSHHVSRARHEIRHHDPNGVCQRTLDQSGSNWISNAPGVATGRIVTATPKLRTGAKAATDCSLYHWPVARGAMRSI